MQFLEAAKKLISIDTSPAQGNLEAVQFLKSLAEGFGFSVQTVEEVVGGVGQANIFIRPNKNEQKLLLQTHLDTVDPGSFALWNKTGNNPYQASIRGEKIYGLGAADVKLDFLCKLYAMKRVDWSQRQGSAVLLGTFGEEEQMKGAVRAVRNRLIKPTPTLIGEPTDLHLIYAGKGIAQVEIIIPYGKKDEEEWAEEGNTASTQSKIFQGKSAHSSTPEMGENAITKMLEYLDLLPENTQILSVDGGVSFNTIPTQSALEFDLTANAKDDCGRRLREIYRFIKKLNYEFKLYTDPDFDPATTTLNVGVIRTLSDHLKMLGAVRWSSRIPEAQYLRWMNGIAEACKQQKAVFRTLDVKKPFATDKNGTFVQTCKGLLQELSVNAELKTQPLTNEANVFSRFGFECIVFGPGQRQNNTHTPDEHVDLISLKRAEDFYVSIMERMCV